MKNDFLRGVFYVFSGIKLFCKDRQAWKYALPPLLLMSALYILLGIVLFWLTGNFALNFLPEWCNETLQGIMYFFSIVLAFFLLPVLSAGTLYEICGGIFFDRLTEFWERKYHSHTRNASWAETGKFAWESFVFAAQTLFWQLLLLFSGLFLPVIAQILTVWIMGRLMAVALLSSTGFNHGISISEISRLVKRNNCLLGFGVASYAISLIPFAIIIILPGLITGAAELYHAELQNTFTSDRRKDF